MVAGIICYVVLFLVIVGFITMAAIGGNDTLNRR
jgi:hypothetical protein